MDAASMAVLERTRAQGKKIMRLREQCEVIVPCGAYRSPAFDAAGGGGEKSGLDGSASECRALLEELENAEAAWKEMKARSIEIIQAEAIRDENVRKKVADFYFWYYVTGASVQDAAEMAGVTERTGYSYKRCLRTGRK